MTRFFGILIVFLSGLANAQILDTSHTHEYSSLKTYKVSEEGLHRMEEDSTAIDTALYQFYNSYTAYKDMGAFLDLGFEGSPILNLTSAPELRMEMSLVNPYMSYYFFDHGIHRYHTDRPWTRFNYSQGDNELIFIEGSHGQQFSERLCIGIDYRRLKNHNFYYSNIAGADNIRFTNLFNNKLFAGYHNPERTYEMLATYTWNKNTSIATGGLVDTAFYEITEGRTKLSNQQAHLSQAKNIEIGHTFRLVQFFRLSKEELDSTDPYSLKRFHSQIIVDTRIDNHKLQYVDDSPDSAFYEEKLEHIDDSLHLSKLSNSIAYFLKAGGQEFRAEFLYEYAEYFNSKTIASFNNSYARLNYQLKGSNWNVKTGLDYGLSGFNRRDHTFKGEANYNKGKISIGVKAIHQTNRPSLLNTTIIGSGTPHTTDWNPIRKQGIKAQLGWETAQQKLSCTFNYDQYNYFLYYNTMELYPNQYAQNLRHAYTNINYTTISNRGGLKLNATHQNVNEQQILPRPEWSVNASVFSQFKLFKKRLLTQLGVESMWFTDFDAPRYDPYSRQWRTSNISFRSYPPISVYMNAKVKSVNFGVQMYHVQEGLMGQAFYSSPRYPMMPRVFRLNIRWDFSN